MTYKHVLLGEGIPIATYFSPWISSDEISKVNILNKEARHYCSSAASEAYDVIQADGSGYFHRHRPGALAFSDNHLPYASMRITSYLRLLKPVAFCVSAYCREPEALPIRLFVTYLTFVVKSAV